MPEESVIRLDPHGHRNIKLTWRDDGSGPYCLAWLWDSYVGGGGPSEQEALRKLAGALRTLADEIDVEASKHTFRMKLAPHLCPDCEGRGTYDAYFRPALCATCKGTGGR